MKSVLISIQPKWCELIANGKKTIEVRKTRPKIETPFRVYIYCTYGNEKENYCVGKRGKVIGEFVCDKIVKYDYQVIACAKYEVNGGCVKEELRYNAGACLTAEEMFSYSKGKPLYGWNISELKIYDNPKELREFTNACPDKYRYCQGCKYGFYNISSSSEEYAIYHGGQYDSFETVCTNVITRPPQSWFYVEE